MYVIQVTRDLNKYLGLQEEIRIFKAVQSTDRLFLLPGEGEGGGKVDWCEGGKQGTLEKRTQKTDGMQKITVDRLHATFGELISGVQCGVKTPTHPASPRH